MKITKRQLRRIIREEKARTLYEEAGSDDRGKPKGTPEKYAEAFAKVLTAVSGAEDIKSVRKEDLPELKKAIEILEAEIKKFNQPMGEARRLKKVLRRK